MGALDGKHISIKAPPKSGSLFYNYKGYFSANLLALVDANYKFIYVDIGEYGSNTDGNVFQFSNFGKLYIDYKLNVPPIKRLQNFPQEGKMPHVIVADEVFPLLHNLIRPYPGQPANLPKEEAVFNYRLIRVCMVVENAFGILIQRWCIFDRKIPLSECNVDSVVKAACVLHNYLTEEKDIDEIFALLNPMRERFLTEDGVACLYMPQLNRYRSTIYIYIFKGYFNSPQGMLHWQNSAHYSELQVVL